MRKKLFLSLIILVLIMMGVVGLRQVSANPLWSPVLPPTPTPGSKGLDQEELSVFSGPLATQKPSSPEEQKVIDQLQQSPILGEEQGFAIPTRVGQSAKDELASYLDPNFGFSFTYPANWQVDAPVKKAYSELPEHGYLVTIRNFNNVVAKRDLNPDEIKVDLWLFPKPEKYSTLVEWTATQTLFVPETTYSKTERISIGDKQIIIWTATGPTVPQGARLYAIEQPTFIYLVVGYPSTSLNISALDELVESLR